MPLLGIGFLLPSIPLLWWNMQNGWIHIAALESRSGVKESVGLHPVELVRFMGVVFGVVSPLLMAGIVAAAIALAWKHRDDLRARFLLSQSLPLFGLFAFFSLNKAGKSNWIAPALVVSVVFTVVFWRELTVRRPAWRWGVAAALGVAFLMTVVIHETAFLNLPPSVDPLRRGQGWADFASHVERARQTHRTELLIGNHYSQASMMAFYLPDRPVTYIPPEEYGKSQFSLWPPYPVKPMTRALFVSNSMRGAPKTLQEQFESIELVDDFVSQHKGRPMTRFRIYLCTRATTSASRQ